MFSRVLRVRTWSENVYRYQMRATAIAGCISAPYFSQDLAVTCALATPLIAPPSSLRAMRCSSTGTRASEHDNNNAKVLLGGAGARDRAFCRKCALPSSLVLVCALLALVCTSR